MLNHIIDKLFTLRTSQVVELSVKALGKDETKNE